MSARDLLTEVLSVTFNELHMHVVNPPGISNDVKDVQESVLLAEHLLNTYAMYAQTFDDSPRAAEFWRKNLPVDVRVRLLKCEGWLKMLKATYGETN